MSGPIRVLELRSVWGTGGGPEKTILAGARRITPDIAVTVCYIRDTRDPVFSIDERAQLAGVDYLEVRERHSLDPSYLVQAAGDHSLPRDRHRSCA